MQEDHAAEERLAELTWRTVKLRVSLLVLTILILLIVWSALINGDKQAQQVDIDFCKQSIAESNKQQPSFTLSADTWCSTSRGARNYLEGGRAASKLLLIASQDLAETNKDAADKLLKQYTEKQSELAEYDAKRRAAYPLQMQLSSEYSGSNIVLNGRLVAEILPFGVMLVVSLVVLLGFQQASYKRQLVSHLNDSTQRALGNARAQFFAGVVQPNSGSILQRLLTISPEGLAVVSLYVLLLIAFVAVLFVYVADIIDLTNSIFLSYPFAVYTAAFLLSGLLFRMRRIYLEQSEEVAGLNTRFKTIETPHRMRRWEGIFASVGILSFFLPWASGEGSVAPLWGFRLLLRQPIIRQILGVASYPLDLKILFEVRIQLVCALLFLLTAGLNAAVDFSKHLSVAKALQRAQKLLALLVLFFSLNFLLYMGILESGGELADNPFLAKLFDKSFGYPMSTYNPTYGFILFLACCAGLIWISLRRSLS